MFCFYTGHLKSTWTLNAKRRLKLYVLKVATEALAKFILSLQPSNIFSMGITRRKNGAKQISREVYDDANSDTAPGN
jgi:hypothetical protein